MQQPTEEEREEKTPLLETPPEMDAYTLFVVGFFFEIGLVLIAALVGWIFVSEPFPFELRYDLEALTWGVVATIPWAAAAVLLTSRFGRRVGFVGRIYEHLKHMLGRGIRDLRLEEIIILAAAAGIGEEVLFRGVLQGLAGIWITSLVFGALHALTPAYFILATGIGLYLGFLQDHTGNLLVPITVHWLYDCVALVLLRKELRRDLPPAVVETV
jgi:membrane protease YdiL (CAAX protease family)